MGKTYCAIGILEAVNLTEVVDYVTEFGSLTASGSAARTIRFVYIEVSPYLVALDIFSFMPILQNTSSLSRSSSLPTATYPKIIVEHSSSSIYISCPFIFDKSTLPPPPSLFSCQF